MTVPAPVWPDVPLILIKAGTSGAPGQVDLPARAARYSDGTYVDENGERWLPGSAIVSDWEPMTAVPTRLVNQLRDAAERPLCSAGLVRDAARNLLKEVTSD